MQLLKNPQIIQIARRLEQSLKEVEENNADPGNGRKFPLHFKIISVRSAGRDVQAFKDRAAGRQQFEAEINEIEELYEPESITAIKIHLFAGPKATVPEIAEIELGPAEDSAGSKKALSGESSQITPPTTVVEEKSIAHGYALQLKDMQHTMEINNLRYDYERRLDQQERHYMRQIDLLQQKNNQLEVELSDAKDEVDFALNGPGSRNDGNRIIGEIIGSTVVKIATSPVGLTLLKKVGLDQNAIDEMLRAADEHQHTAAPIAAAASSVVEESASKFDHFPAAEKAAAEALVDMFTQMDPDSFAIVYTTIRCMLNEEGHFSVAAASLIMNAAQHLQKTRPELYTKTNNNA